MTARDTTGSRPHESTDSERSDTEPIDVPTVLDEPVADRAAPIEAKLSVSLRDDPLFLADDYPGGELSDGELCIDAYSGVVTVEGHASDGDRHFNPALTLAPDDCERLGELLIEFAKKARAGEEWIHP